MKIGDKVKVVFPRDKEMFRHLTFEIIRANGSDYTIKEINGTKEYRYYPQWLNISENQNHHPHTRIFL